ncbi:hypothetical protein C0995_008737 [Termitomyces sp. Mi166|nr:hypothetical protein C0995_008737 [Termitomyces sp. Mi166\
MSSTTRCYLTSIPLEILHHIAVDLTKFTPIGPAVQLVPLMRTCTTLKACLSPKNNPNLLGAIYHHKFDSAAVERRSGRLTPMQWAAWGARAFDAMCLFRRGDVRCDHGEKMLLEALRVGVMLMLDDDGKNARQMLLWAHADEFVQRLVMTRLYERSEENQGWPRETPLIAYALQLMWLLTSEERLLSESQTVSAQLKQLLVSFVYCPFRYPSTPFPPNHYIIPPLLPSPMPAPTTIQTAHGPYPLYPPSLASFFELPNGQQMLLAPPPPALMAKLLYLAREEACPLPVAPHLFRTRADSEAAGIFTVGPVREDVEELNWSYVARPPLGTGLRTREGVLKVHPDWDGLEWSAHPFDGDDRQYPPRPEGMKFPGFEAPPPIDRWIGKAPLLDDEKSIKWDMDFCRMRAWADVDAGTARKPFEGGVYEPGTATGLWVGRLLACIPALEMQQTLVINPIHPPDLTVDLIHGYHQASFMRMREIHGVHGEVVPLPSGSTIEGDDEGDDEDDDEGDDEGDWESVSGDYVEEEEEEPFALGPLTEHDGMNDAWFAGRPRVLSPRFEQPPDIVRIGVDGIPGIGKYRANRFTGRWTGGARLGNDAPPVKRSSRSNEERRYPHDATTCPRCKDDEAFAQKVKAAAGQRGMELHALLEAHRVREKCNGIKEIVILGETDPVHGAAFQHWELEGRIRPADGLFLALRRPLEQPMGTTLFWGYFVGGESLVGNWRVGGSDLGAPAWEGTFVWGRRND